MLILLSPAKDLTDTVPKGVTGTSQPALIEHSVPLVERLRKLSVKRLGKLMDINPKLAELNHQRYQEWSIPFDRRNAVPAVFAFNGEVYRGLNARTLSSDDLRFAQHHLRILSGLYGVLRPLDLMQAYRLEMGTRMSAGRGMKDLYAYWGSRITDLLNEELERTGSDVVVNLASNEYFKAVDTASLRANVITPVFKDRVGNNYRMLMVYAKHQRGAMSRYIIQHRILDAVKLKKYDVDGYRYSAVDSTADQWVFLRDAR